MPGQHRAKTPPPAVTVWLGTGAVALGIGAALTTGTAVANADTLRKRIDRVREWAARQSG